MTQERYFKMCEQLEQEPIEEEIPPDWVDFPEVVHNAMATFNMLGDRVYPEIGYMGKDYTNLPYFIEQYEPDDKEFFLVILDWLDSRAITSSQEHLKREHDKLKRKK